MPWEEAQRHRVDPCPVALQPYLLAHPILVDGPNSGHMGGKQLVLGEGGIAGPGTDEPGLAHSIVPDHNALDGLYVWPFIIHVKIH